MIDNYDAYGDMGITLNGRYRLIRPLGEGTQGAVYEVMDTVSSCRRALKLSPDAGAGALETEYTYLLDLQHPNLASVFDFQRIQHVVPAGALPESHVFFTEALVDGIRADRYIEAQAPEARLESTVNIGVGVARALRLLHSRGLLHLDVKPSNIIVDRDGIPHLIDLGLARFKHNAIGIKAGTLGYMADELFEGLADERSDIYALGQVLIQLIGGVSPAFNIDAQGVGAQTPIPGSVPPPLAKVLRRMIHPRLEQRFSARETILALQKSGAGSKISADGHLDDASEAEDAVSRLAAAKATRFVGRQGAVRQLRTFIRETFEQDRLGLGIVNGAVGVGKTRLVRKVVASEQIDHVQHAKRSITYLSGTFTQILSQMRNRLSASERAKLTDLPGYEGGEGMVRQPESDVGYVSESAMAGLFDMMRRQFGPMVILLHDATAQQFVAAAHMVQRESFSVDGGVVLLFENSDVTFSKELAGTALLLSLAPLSSAEEQQMVTDITGVALSDSMASRIHRIAGGNPRFVEALVEQFFFVDNRYQLGDMPADITFPEDVGLLVARRLLAHVDTVEREILSVLSLVQVGLDQSEIYATLGSFSATAVDNAVNRLGRAGYLQLNGGWISLVSYVSNGIRLSLENGELARLSGQLFEGLHPQRSAAERGQLAFAGAKLKEAVPLLQAAITKATDAGDMSLSISCLEKLLACDGAGTDALRLQLAVCYRRSGRYQKALHLVAEVLDADDSGEALFEKAASLRLDGRVDEAHEILTGLQTSPEPLVRASAKALLARIYLDRGDPLKGLALVAGESLSDQLAHQSGMFNIRGLLMLHTGDVAGAQDIFNKGLSTVSHGSPIEAGRYHAYLGMVSHVQKDWAAAAQRYETAFRFADESGDSHGAATYVVNWAAALTELGDVQNALIRYRNGMNRLRLVGRPVELVQAESNYAQLLLRLGDGRDALWAARKAVGDMNENENPLVFGHALTVLGESLLATGQYADAAEALARAVAIFDRRKQLVQRDFALLHLADSVMHMERIDDAYSQFSKIESDIVFESHAWLALRVMFALRGRGAVSSSVMDLDGALSEATQLFSLESYQAMAIAAIGALRLGNVDRCYFWSVRALELLDEIRRQTPAVHQPDSYPYEVQLLNMRTQTDARLARTELTAEENSMKQIWMERLIRIAARLNSELNVDAQLDIIMDTAIDVTGAERGFLLLREDDGSFSVRSARNLDSEAILAKEQNYSGSVARRAFEQGEPIVTTNAQEDEQYRDYRSVALLNLMYIVAVPLLVKGEARGTIYLDSTTRGQFDGERVALLKMLAHQAAVALTNARLLAHVQKNHVQIESLNRKLESRLEITERELAATRQNLREVNGEFAAQYDYHGIIGASRPMMEIFRLLDRVAATDIPVVISGESGTGKELAARAIHQAGGRRDKPFIAENCAAIPAPLLESVLFGHVRGAFTGAVRNRSGLFAEAHGGTLFLDEIADMPIEMQSKLLRVLQDGKVRPVGQNNSIKVDVRILVASNADLKECVRKGTFREDLYYRLHVMELRLPPLRERSIDIPMLVRGFLKKHAPSRQIEISREAMAHLMHYRWPGNVRQLENEIVRATVMCGDIMDVSHFSEALREFSIPVMEDATDLNLEGHVNRLKIQLIRAALNKSGGNRSRASELLGISRFGLQKMMARLEL
ncbi:MAG: sigma 54-interacting transcriptional regulator [Deltaproteobacteria bacterium]|nr:sigma 54-interacting transcriptional regulator [Deltaproteobacteria bacterium]